MHVFRGVLAPPIDEFASGRAALPRPARCAARTVRATRDDP